MVMELAIDRTLPNLGGRLCIKAEHMLAVLITVAAATAMEQRWKRNIEELSAPPPPPARGERSRARREGESLQATPEIDLGCLCVAQGRRG